MSDFNYYQSEELWSKANFSEEKILAEDVNAMLPSDITTILDAGCGNGVITNTISDRYEVYGCDISPAALKETHRPAAVADLNYLPFADNTFDLVLCTDVLEHIPEENYATVCAELFRVSKRYLLIAVPHREILEYASVNCQACDCHYHVHWHQRSYSLADLQAHWQNHSKLANCSLSTNRWSWSHKGLLDLRTQQIGSHYPFPQALCPQCGAGYQVPVLNPQTQQIQQEFDVFHHWLAESDSITWPTQSEILVLFDKSPQAKDQNFQDFPIEYCPTLPERCTLAEIAERVDPISYAREAYWVECKPESRILVLPYLPESLSLPHRDIRLKVYDALRQNYIEIPGESIGSDQTSFYFSPLAPTDKGYLIQLSGNVESLTELNFSGKLLVLPKAEVTQSTLLELRSRYLNHKIDRDHRALTGLILENTDLKNKIAQLAEQNGYHQKNIGVLDLRTQTQHNDLAVKTQERHNDLAVKTQEQHNDLAIRTQEQYNDLAIRTQEQHNTVLEKLSLLDEQNGYHRNNIAALDLRTQEQHEKLDAQLCEIQQMQEKIHELYEEIKLLKKHPIKIILKSIKLALFGQSKQQTAP